VKLSRAASINTRGFVLHYLLHSLKQELRYYLID